MFFTLDNTAQVLELVNSDTYDGIWDCRIYPEYIDGSLIHPSDRKRVCSEIEHQLDLGFRVRADRSEEYRWVNLYGTVLQNENGEQTRLVGCVHDIQQRKLLEREQQQKQFYDPVTEFYRLKYGLESAKIIRQMQRSYCQTVPIVAMSANAFAEDVKQSLASGMNAHLSKPVNLQMLDQTLYQFMGAQEYNELSE